MKALIAFAIAAVCVCGGCSYKAGTETQALSTEYRGAVKYMADDISQERAEWGIVSFRVSRMVGAGCESRSRVQDYQTYVPYRFDTEMGNFMQGLVSAVLLPITLPLFAMSGSDDEILNEHFRQIGNNLDVFQATPPDDKYLFTTAVKRRPLGAPREGAWDAVTDTTTLPLAGARVEMTIDSLRFDAEETTNDDGVVNFDVPQGGGFRDGSRGPGIRGGAGAVGHQGCERRETSGDKGGRADFPQGASEVECRRRESRETNVDCRFPMPA